MLQDGSDNDRDIPTEVALLEVNGQPPAKGSLEAPPTSHAGLEVLS